MKRFLSLVLCCVLLFTMTISSFATELDGSTLNISTETKTYEFENDKMTLKRGQVFYLPLLWSDPIIFRCASSHRNVIECSYDKKTNSVKIIAKRVGVAVCTVEYTDGQGHCFNDKLAVKVQKSTVKLKKLAFTEKKIYLKKGSKVQLELIKTPITSTEKITYSSSKKKIASVNKKGVVTAKKKGTTKITAKSAKGKKATCTIVVRN